MFEDHTFQECLDNLLLFGSELGNSFELEAEISIRAALIRAKDQLILITPVVMRAILKAGMVLPMSATLLSSLPIRMVYGNGWTAHREVVSVGKLRKAIA